jgi:hypothetical protein
VKGLEVDTLHRTSQQIRLWMSIIGGQPYFKICWNTLEVMIHVGEQVV